MRHRDRLDGDPAAGGEHPVDGLEVGPPELVADGLDHLDRDHGVVRRPGGGERAVVAQLDLDAVGEPGRGDPLLGQLELLDRQRDRVDGRAAAGGADRELAPAGADLEHPGALGDAGLVEQPLDLAALRLGEVGAWRRVASSTGSVGWRPGGRRRSRGPRAGWRRCRTGPRSSSASRRGRARTGRWTGRSGARCWPGCWPRCCAGGAAARGITKARSLCSGSGTSVGIWAASTVRKPAEVVGVPGAGQVGLAEADQAVAAEPGEELVGSVQAHRRAALAEVRPVGVLDDGDVEAVDGGAEEAPGDGGGDGGAGAGGQRLEAGHALAWPGCRSGRFFSRVIGRPPVGGGWGRGRIGRRRAHSQMPCARISALPRSAAPRVLRTGMSLRVPVRQALNGARRSSRRGRAA